jgi:hypothetical protein
MFSFSNSINARNNDTNNYYNDVKVIEKKSINSQNKFGIQGKIFDNKSNSIERDDRFNNVLL